MPGTEISVERDHRAIEIRAELRQLVREMQRLVDELYDLEGLPR